MSEADRLDGLEHLDGPDGLAVAATGAGPAVLWVHGYTMDSPVWADLWSLLPGHRHLGVDLPWHGRSRGLRDGETLAGLTDTLAGWCRDLEPRPVEHAVGLSFGTVVVLELLLRRPGLLRSAVLASPAAAGAPGDPDVERRYQAVLDAHRRDGPGPGLTDLWLAEPSAVFGGVLARPRVAGRVTSRVRRHGWRELAAGGMRPLLAVPQRPEGLAASGARTLVLVGEHELPAHRLVAARLAAAGARACLLEGAGHLPLLEEPAAVAPLLRQHWAG